MKGIEFRKRLKEGKRVFGTMIVSPSPRWVDVISGMGLDFVFIDTEHIAIDRHQLSWMCHGYSGKELLPIVRISAPDPYQACMVLDGGAKGIVAPYVETADQVQQLRGAVKTRPLKGKKLQDYLDGTKELEPELADYINTGNSEHVLIVNIESQTGIDNLDEILNVPGLDAVLIGPHDLSTNLGVPEQYDHPAFNRAVEKIITTARNANVGAGIHVFFENSVKQEIEYVAMGANLILHSGDINLFAEKLGKDIQSLREELKDIKQVENRNINI
jgi:2-keto-3-deoxy-L-rhamnonate aldolase RhmA